MKIVLVVVGETRSDEIKSLMNDYSKRIANYNPIELVVTTEERLGKTIDRYDRIILLEELGKPRTSLEFADFLESQMTYGSQSLAFVIGGPYGFSDAIKAAADDNISLSRMTFPHDLVRVIFLEQLYRAFTILKNEKYHHP